MNNWLKVSILIFFVTVLYAFAQGVPTWIFGIGPLNPAGYCVTQLAPTGVGGTPAGFFCVDGGGVFYANSGAKFAAQGGGTQGPKGDKGDTGATGASGAQGLPGIPGTPAPSNWTGSFKITGANPDGSLIVTCTNCK
jgi:hypothetical protein